MEIVYSQTRHPLVSEARRYQNPRLFAGVLPGATSVQIVGNWPRIAAAYAALGVPVQIVEDDGSDRTLKALLRMPEGEPGAVVTIPAEWRDLPWPQLRSLAASLSGSPIINRAQAEAAIDEAVRRDLDDDSAGVTKREIIADLTAMDVEFDSRATRAELLELRDTARVAGNHDRG